MPKYMIGQWHQCIRDYIVEADSLAEAIAKIIDDEEDVKLDYEGSAEPDHLKGMPLDEVPDELIEKLDELQDRHEELLTNQELHILPSIAYWETR